MSINRYAGSSAALAVAAATAAGVVLPSPAFGQTVSDGALSDLQVQKVGDCSTVTINFNTRVQLLSFFPEKSGRELHIRVNPIDSTAVALGRDSLRTPSSLPELRSVSFEGDNPGGPVLSLFFTKDMNFTVDAGASPSALVVRVAKPGTDAACTAKAAPSGGEQAGAQAAIPPGLYAVNLASTPNAVLDLNSQQKQAVSGHVLYETQFEKDAQTWHRLRLGFYETREQADAAKKQLQALFPEAWVIKVSPNERQDSVSSPVQRAGTQPASAPPSASVGSEADTAETARLIGESESAIQDNQTDRAIQLLTNATLKPENANTPRAIELLGLAREKKGQTAHARAQYEEYLRRYPSGEGADRVRQRLAALDGGSAPAAGTPLREASGINAGGAGKWKWGLRGSFSQFYFRDQGRTSTLTTSSTLGNEVDNSVNVNQLLTSGDVTISGGNDRRMFQVRAAGSYTKNFGTSTSVTTINNGTEQQTFNSRPGGGIGSVSALYFDYTDNDLNTQLRVGRQTRNSQGVLGRFDGALLGFQANPRLRFNLVGGFPVWSSRQTRVMTERPFYGVSVDLGAKRSPFQFSAYWFDQHAKGGFVDRRSVGVEARVLQKNFNAYGMMDFDVKYKVVNLGLMTFNYNFPDSSSLSVTADYRRAPMLAASNALNGMSVAQLDAAGVPVFTIDPVTSLPVQTFLPPKDLSGLRPFFTDTQIYQLGKDRTIISKSLTVTYSRPITKKLQTSVDFTLTDTGGAPGLAKRLYVDPGGDPLLNTLVLYNEVSPLPATGKEYYYGLQLIGSDLVMPNDIYILSGRYADTSTARIYTADFNARLPVTNSFRLSPRVRYGFRENKATNGGNFSQFQPTVRFNYFPLKHSEVEIEVGANFSKQTVWNSTNSTFDKVTEKGWVLTAGYRIDF